jgi:hypothetical protein
VAWFPGWKARLRGRELAVSPDGMGFLMLQPQCEGDCEIELAWTGRGDRWITAAISAAALALLAAMIWKRP